MRRTKANPDALMVTPEDVNKTLNIGLSRVYSLCKIGALPSIRCGRRILIPRRAVEEFVEKVINGEIREIGA